MTDRNSQRRVGGRSDSRHRAARTRGTAARALALDAQSRVCEQSLLSAQFRCGGRAPAAICGPCPDLARFPFTTKADLREAYPFGFFAVPMEKIARVHASSGTTGKPTVVGYTRKDIATWSNLVARSIRAAGGRRGMKVHVGYGYGSVHRAASALITAPKPRAVPSFPCRAARPNGRYS